jgi:hypothetical protein
MRGGQRLTAKNEKWAETPSDEPAQAVRHCSGGAGWGIMARYCFAAVRAVLRNGVMWVKVD